MGAVPRSVVDHASGIRADPSLPVMLCGSLCAESQMVSLVLKDCQEDLAFVLVAENVYFVPSRKAFVHLLLNYTCLYVHVHSITHMEDRGQRASCRSWWLPGNSSH